jgi:hypothetical protein
MLFSKLSVERQSYQFLEFGLTKLVNMLKDIYFYHNIHSTCGYEINNVISSPSASSVAEYDLSLSYPAVCI